jgi:hypothetical protein
VEQALLVSIAVMAAHKLECWITREWEVSPFFQWLVPRLGARDPGEVVFGVFVLWLMIGLALAWLLLVGGPARIVGLAAWGLTFGLEWHHLARVARRREYYAGAATAALYVAFGPYYWWQLWQIVTR